MRGDRSLIHRLATLPGMVDFVVSTALAGRAKTGIMLPFDRKMRSRWQTGAAAVWLPAKRRT